MPGFHGRNRSATAREIKSPSVKNIFSLFISTTANLEHGFSKLTRNCDSKITSKKMFLFRGIFRRKSGQNLNYEMVRTRQNDSEAGNFALHGAKKSRRLTGSYEIIPWILFLSFLKKRGENKERGCLTALISRRH